MKKLHLILLTFLLIANQSFEQNTIWSLPGNYVKQFTPFSLPSLLSPYTSNHNAYPAPDGSFDFYVVDEYVYDGNGALIGAMWLPTAVELL